ASIDHIEVPFDASGNLVTFSGYIEIPEEGEYTFQMTSSEQVILRIHDALVVDGDFQAGSIDSAEGALILQVGLHPIRIYVKNDENESWDFDLKVKSPSGSGFMAISEELFYH